MNARFAQNELEVCGKLGLVVSNPPCGIRGASLTEDSNKSYRELFFRARGGELPSVLLDDLPVALGRYFEQFPQHILGTERGTAGDEDDTTSKPRRGYEVDGTFTALPDFVERSMCTRCAVTPFYTAPERPRLKATPKDALRSTRTHQRAAEPFA